MAARGAVLALLLLLGCGPSEPVGDAGAGAGQVDSGEPEDPWADFQVDRPEAAPAWTAEEIEELLQTWAETVSLPRPEGLFAEYRAALLEGDESCPGTDDDITDVLSGCTSSTGWTYSGLCILDEEERLDEEGETTSSTVSFQVADFVITDPDGRRFSAGGRAQQLWSVNPDGSTTGSGQVVGTWSHDWTELTWLQDPLSADLSLHRNTGSQQTLRIHGSLTSGDVTTSWDTVDLDARDCPGLPTAGTIWLRQPDASWNQLVFTDSCDGCAEVTWNGTEVLGTACLDLSHVRVELTQSLEVPP